MTAGPRRKGKLPPSAGVRLTQRKCRRGAGCGARPAAPPGPAPPRPRRPARPKPGSPRPALAMETVRAGGGGGAVESGSAVGWPGRVPGVLSSERAGRGSRLPAPAWAVSLGPRGPLAGAPGPGSPACARAPLPTPGGRGPSAEDAGELPAVRALRGALPAHGPPRVARRKTGPAIR